MEFKEDELEKYVRSAITLVVVGTAVVVPILILIAGATYLLRNLPLE